MLIQSMRSKLPYISVSELLQEIIEETGYVRELEAEIQRKHSSEWKISMS